MNKLEGFKVVETGMTIGGREMSKFCPTKEEAEAEKEIWRKDGMECGVIVWKE